MLQGKGFLSWRQSIHPFRIDETGSILVPKPLVSPPRLYPGVKGSAPMAKGANPKTLGPVPGRSVPSLELPHRRDITLQSQTKAFHDMAKAIQSLVS